MSQVWQIGGGEAGRFYSNLFFQYDCMFLGPGRFGSYERSKYRAAGWAKKSAIDAIDSFCTRIEAGDRVVVREGHKAVGLGVVADAPYMWVKAFDDVYGWDLQHTRRVVWQPHLREELLALQREAALFDHMKQISMLTRVNQPDTLGKLEPLFEKCETRDLGCLPDDLPEPLSLEELGAALFSKGLANDSVDKVIAAITRQRRLLQWYKEHGASSGRPTEHEVVAHMILPLLLALGWSEQLLAVEWNKIDLAAFWGTPTTKDKCSLVCEAKSAGRGLQNVLEQPIEYANKHNLLECKKILLTEGGRFYVHERDLDGGFMQNATGYFNVEKIRTNHIVPSGTNAVDTLIALTPANVRRPIVNSPI